MFRKKSAITKPALAKTPPAITEDELETAVNRTRASRKTAKEHKKAMVAYLELHSDKTNSAIACATNVDKAVVSKARKELELAGTIQPKQRKTPKISDAASTPLNSGPIHTNLTKPSKKTGWAFEALQQRQRTALESYRREQEAVEARIKIQKEARLRRDQELLAQVKKQKESV